MIPNKFSSEASGRSTQTTTAKRLDRNARERQLIDAVERMTTANGYSPTLRELATAVGVSLTRIAQLMAACEEQGLISRVPGISRTYRVIRREVSHV